MEQHRRRRARILGTIVAAVAAVAVSVAGVLAAPGPDAGAALEAPHAHMAHQRAVSPKLAFHDEMRKLWEDHITWTRLFIVSFTEDLPDLAATKRRLLQNQVDIGDAVRPFYGDAAGRRLTVLLTDHITTAATLLQAAKDGDADAFEAARNAWYRNARQIARFLHDANPDVWPLSELKTMMREHLELTLAEAAARLEGAHRREVVAYDAVHEEILRMADMLSDGIIEQFPGRF